MQGVSVELLGATVKKLEQMYGPRFVAPTPAMNAFIVALGEAEAAFQLLLPAPPQAAPDRPRERREADEVFH